MCQTLSDFSRVWLRDYFFYIRGSRECIENFSMAVTLSVRFSRVWLRDYFFYIHGSRECIVFRKTFPWQLLSPYVLLDFYVVKIFVLKYFRRTSTYENFSTRKFFQRKFPDLRYVTCKSHTTRRCRMCQILLPLFLSMKMSVCMGSGQVRYPRVISCTFVES